MADTGQITVEFVHTADKVAGGVDSTLKTIRAISASEAFRKYNWLKNIPITNAAGNLRGMVVSARWKTVFTMATDAGEAVGRVALVVGFAANIAESSHRIHEIYKSKEPWDAKASRISTQVSSAAIRTLGGVVPAAASIVFLSAQGYCQLGGLAFNANKSAQQCVDGFKKADSYVSSTFKKVTDGDNIYLWINTHLVVK